MKRYLLLIFVTCIGTFVYAQNPDIEDLVRARKMSVEKIDSMMQQKQYVKKVIEQDKDLLIVYTFTSLANGPVMRSVHIGKRGGQNGFDVEYGVWQKADAVDFIDQLVKKGFKRKITNMPIIGGGTMSSTTFIKDKITISYREEKQDANVTLYLFSINN